MSFTGPATCSPGGCVEDAHPWALQAQADLQALMVCDEGERLWGIRGSIGVIITKAKDELLQVDCPVLRAHFFTHRAEYEAQLRERGDGGEYRCMLLCASGEVCSACFGDQKTSWSFIRRTPRAAPMARST